MWERDIEVGNGGKGRGMEVRLERMDWRVGFVESWSGR